MRSARQPPTLLKVKKNIFAGCQSNFWAGLAIVLPAVLSVAVLTWLFGTVANLTDTLLIFVPRHITHHDQGAGPMYWYWSVMAFVVAILLIGAIGVVARNYFGRKLIEWVDAAMLRVPLLNKVYGMMKQVNDAFSSNKKTAFRTVVLIEFPRDGLYSVGFVTSEQHDEMQAVTREKVVCVFVPTTPNPTSGFLVLVPENKLTKLQMSVPEAIKYIISLGSLSPEYRPESSREPRHD